MIHCLFPITGLYKAGRKCIKKEKESSLDFMFSHSSGLKQMCSRQQSCLHLTKIITPFHTSDPPHLSNHLEIVLMGGLKGVGAIILPQYVCKVFETVLSWTFDY